MTPEADRRSRSGERSGAIRSVAAGLWLAAVFLVSGCDDSEGLVARVDHAPIAVAEVDLLLRKRGLTGKSATAEQRARAEEELIDQALFVQQARTLGLDQKPEHVQAVKELLARAYLESLVGDLDEAGEHEVKSFYEAHPELFSERRRYQLQEIAIQVGAGQLPAVEKQFETMSTFNDMVAWLKLHGIGYKVAATFKSADEIPADVLAHLKGAREGQALKVRIPGGLAALQVVRIIPDPLSLEAARGDIRRYLRNRRIEGLLKESAKGLRASAKIERYASGGQRAPE